VGAKMKRKMISHIWGHSKQGVCHTVALPFTFKSMLRQKNYGNSNISPCKNVIFKIPLKETKILQDIITLDLIMKYQQKPKYHLSKILI
jgi:hypothetical protein